MLDNDDNDDDDNNDAVSDDEFMYSFILQFKFRFAFSQPTSINESTRDVQTNKAVMKVLVLQHDFFFLFLFSSSFRKVCLITLFIGRKERKVCQLKCYFFH